MVQLATGGSSARLHSLSLFGCQALLAILQTLGALPLHKAGGSCVRRAASET